MLLQEEVLHLRGLSLAEDGVIGLSPLDCMREAVGLALAAEAYGARFYRNNARPGIVLKHPGRLSPDAGKRLKESWNSNLDGLLRGDIESRYRAYATGRQWGWLSANDVREREDMNRIDGGDLYLAPVNMTPAEKLAAAVGEIAAPKGYPNDR